MTADLSPTASAPVSASVPVPTAPGRDLPQRQAQKPARPRRDDIDTIRAIACIALVSFHVVGVSAGAGLELPADHPLRLLNDGLAPLRMPIFAFLSGMVFRCPAPQAQAVAATLLSKARRLLLPLVSVASLFWISRSLAGSETAPFGLFLVRPYAHFWFLQSSFLIMFCLSLACWAFGGRAARAAWALMALAVGWSYLGLAPQGDWFSLVGALRLMPFFMLGNLVAQGRLGPRLQQGPPPAAASASPHPPDRLRLAGLGMTLGAAVAGFLLPHGGLFTALLTVPESAAALRLALLATGITGCLGLLLLAPRHPAMAWLGRSSYAIYLFHVFFTAAVTEALRGILPGLSPWAIWPVSLAAGLAGPVILQQLILRAGGWFPVLFLGLRPRPRRLVPPGISAGRA